MTPTPPPPPEATVAVELLHTDPLDQRVVRPDAGFSEDFVARTVELLHALRSFVRGPYGVYVWALVILGGGAWVVAATWHHPSPRLNSQEGAMWCVSGQTLVAAGGHSWDPTERIRAGVSAVSADGQRTVLAFGRGSTVRFEGRALFNWRPYGDGQVMVTVEEGRAWFELHDDVIGVFPRGTWNGRSDTVLEVNLRPMARRAEIVRCRSGNLQVTLGTGRRAVKLDLHAPEGVVVNTDGQMDKVTEWGPDAEWQTWNEGWSTLHPELGGTAH